MRKSFKNFMDRMPAFAGMTIKMKTPYLKFYLGLLLPLFLFAGYFGLSARLLGNAGEYLTMDEAVGKLGDTYGLYGPALTQKTFYFKKQLYKHLKPEVAALGSSRALQFRGESFRVPFANIGGMSGLDETTEIAHDLFGDHAPKILILGVDFWWFNPLNENIKPKRSPEDGGMTVADLLLPPVWLLSGKLSFRDAAYILNGDVPNVGISAISRNDGFDRFGAYHYTSLWNGGRESEDANFADSLDRIARGAGVFIHGDRVSEVSLKKFDALLEYLSGKKIRVVIFLPPLAPSVLDAMEKNGGYAYMKPAEKKVKALAARHKMPFFDLHDLRNIGASDCEFTDGLHAGQIAADRMLLHMAAAEARLTKAVRLPETAAEIRRYEGRAAALDSAVDLLKRGCAAQP